ncbi:ABC transporter permease [Nonomuraea sp. NBC_01738]|uniref:ABC transporter permease n=1 Tax=Nonomuraea sp. NBC_01738 TaxID=2976003 RepID=UPI002E110518|nr:ABC transporter permease [Nonomuraea sp. NBC_01738]
MISQSLTLTWRSLIPLRNSPGQLAGMLLQPVFMIVIFVYLFGGAASGDRGGAVQYMLPGVLVQVALMATIGTGMNLATDIGNGVFDRFRTMPIARLAPLAGRIMADLCTMLVTLTMSMLVGYVVGFRVATSPLEALAGLALVLLFTSALSWGSALMGLVAKSVTAMQGLSTAVLLPLTFGSSAFIPATGMPGWLTWWMGVNPVSHLAGAMRGLMVGGLRAADVWITLGWAAGLLIVFVPLALRAYNRRVR